MSSKGASKPQVSITVGTYGTVGTVGTAIGTVVPQYQIAPPGAVVIGRTRSASQLQLRQHQGEQSIYSHRRWATTHALRGLHHMLPNRWCSM